MQIIMYVCDKDSTFLFFSYFRQIAFFIHLGLGQRVYFTFSVQTVSHIWGKLELQAIFEKINQPCTLIHKCITKFAVLCPYSNQQAFYSACTGKKTLKPSFVFYKLTHNVLSPNHDLQPNLHSDVSQASIAVWCPHSNLQTIFSGNKLIVYVVAKVYL